MELVGIDVSVFQKTIDWSQVKSQGIDFAMIRAGYGRNNVDQFFVQNVEGCHKNGIKAGAYWFSYAYTVEQAIAEAKTAVELCKEYQIDFPLAFDYEYDSENYAKAKGIIVTAGLMNDMCVAFCEEVKNAGLTPMIYTNIDYLNRGFSKIVDQYPLWIAYWGKTKPSKYDYDIWQYSSTGQVKGISGNVDMNICVNTDWSSSMPEPKEDDLFRVRDKFWGIYTTVAREVINGEWGNGKERAERLQAAGYDYKYVQSIVNMLV